MATHDKTDMRSWKKVLLQWVIECEFNEKNFFNLEQSNVDVFFEKYRQRHRHINDLHSITVFLNTFYPEYESHLDDDHALSSTDYVYVYSLLLHFSCVKKPDAYFHDICQKLSSRCQQSIASFFKGLLKTKFLNKESLRRAIANVSVHSATLSECSSNSSVGSSNANATGTSDNSSNMSVTEIARLENSAVKTPIRQGIVGQRNSPSTPKTHLLEERTRDLYNLRAQLETERYEKGLLELQIKQNEEKTTKLNQDHKKLQQQIKDLKNDILRKSPEHSRAAECGNESQIKRKLYKEINQKEDEITKLTDMINARNEEKVLLNEKLLYAQKQIIVCMERIKELDCKVDELNNELEQKQSTIQCLQNNLKDLELFISEMRSASRSQRDSSVECVDISFTREQNSSCSMSSPENLGCSVIDLQLREKQCENAQLREELSILCLNNTRLSNMIQQRAHQLCKECGLQYIDETMDDNGELNKDPIFYFNAYNNFIDQLSKHYKNERNTTSKLRENMEKLQHQNTDLCNRIENFEEEIQNLKENVEHLAAYNTELESNKEDMLSRLSENNNEIQMLSEQKFRLVNQLDSLATEYSNSKDNFKIEKVELNQNIKKLEAEIVLSKEHIAKLNETNMQVQKHSEELQKRNIEQENALKALSDRLTLQQLNVEEQKSGVQLIKEKHEKLLVQCEELKRVRRESDAHLESMESQLAVKEMEMSRLGREITAVRKSNTELEQHIDDMMNKYNMEKQASDSTLNNRNDHIKQLSSECAQLQLELQNTKNHNNKLIEEMQTVQRQTIKILELFQCAETSIQPEDEFTNEIEKIVQQIKQLQNLNINATNKIKLLELQKEEINSKLLKVEKQLQCSQLKYDEKVQFLHNEHQNSMELRSKAEKETQLTRDRLAKKEQELSDAIAQHNKAQLQLQETSLQLEAIEGNYVEGMLSLEQQIDTYSTVNLFIDSNNLHKHIECLHDRKLLFASVEANLKIILEESSNAFKKLHEKMIRYEHSLDNINDTQKQLEADLVAKESELRIVLDEQQQERADWQCQLSQLMRKLTEQSIKQESYELAIDEIVNGLENSICSSKQNSNFDEKHSFDEATVTNDFVALKRLRHTFNVSAIRQKELFDEKQCLEKQLQCREIELKELQETMACKSQSVGKQLNQEVDRLNNELQTLTEVNEKLSEEFSKQQLHILELEKQIERFKESRQTDMRLQLEDQQKLITLQEQHSKCDLKLLEQESQLEYVRRELDVKQQLLSELQSNAHSLQESEERYKKLFKEHEYVEAEVKRLKGELEAVRSECTRSGDELKECKRELQRSNENLSQLIQQIGSIRIEKEAVLEEREQLRCRLDETGRAHNVCEIRIKGVVERSLSLEKQLVNAESEIKTMRAQMINNEKSNERLAAENEKLRDMQSNSIKHIEELKLEMSEIQVCSSTFEKKLTAKIAAEQLLECERDKLKLDSQSLNDRLAKAERAHKHCHTLQTQLEQANSELEVLRQKLDASELDVKLKLSKLEKAREANEVKLRKLNVVISNTESANVKLNHEIGALNSQLQESQKVVSALRTEREERELEVSSHTAKLQEQQQTTIIKLTETTNELGIVQRKCDHLVEELQQLRSELLIIRAEKSHVEQTTSAKLAEYEIDQSVVTSLKMHIAELEACVETKEAQIRKLFNDIDTLNNENEKIRANEEKACAKCAKSDGLLTRLNVAEVMLDKEQQVTAQLRLDNQILQAKYRESKQRLQDENKCSEDRIKENRLELEGKLEKMKNKMKTLYTEEISKMKTKNERETVSFKAETELLKAQNIKYEEYTRKLSSQIVRLNDKILELQKQNTILSAKLKHMQEENQDGNITQVLHTSNKYATLPASISSTAKVAATNLGGTNLSMEDEEGEVFNNTYLTDLKLGRMPDFMGRDVCPKELQYRNSLLPPHLKSAYAAQYDYGLQDDDVKDGCLNNLDDSMSALLSTTNIGNTRKKISGATHYKRPGPPTPSKNGGRLSFGSSSEPPREILKETYEASCNAGLSSSSTKTPARFGFFASRFSLGGNNGGSNIGPVGGIKDENTPPKRRLSNMFKRK